MIGSIAVYRDWTGDEVPRRLGTLRVSRARTSEVFDFTFDDVALADSALASQHLDPDLQLFAGPQFAKNGRSVFGVFKDSNPIAG